MSTLLKRSIPLLTPPMTTAAVKSRYTTPNMIGAHWPVIKPVKYPSATAFLPLPVMKSVKYFKTHPPIVQ